MKCKQGFVSNSSSTSFIVFSNDPIDYENVIKKLDGELSDEYYPSKKGPYTPDEVASHIIQCMHEGDIFEKDEYCEIENCTEILYNLIKYYEDCLDYSSSDSYMFIVRNEHREISNKLPENIIKAYWNYKHIYDGMFKNTNKETDGDRQKRWDEYQEAHTTFYKTLKPYCEKQLEKYLKQYKHVQQFEIGDDSSLGATIEHGYIMGDIFEKVIKISNH